MLEFHQAVVSTLRDADEAPVPLDPAPLPPNIPQTNPLLTHTSEDLARLSEVDTNFGADQNDEDAADNGKKFIITYSMSDISKKKPLISNILFFK